MEARDTALFTAVFRKDEQGVRNALLGGGNVNARNNEDGSTPLHYAAWTGHVPVIQLLLTVNTIELETKNHEGNTPLHVAAAYSHLHAVKLLLAAGEFPHSAYIENNDKKKPFEYATNSNVRQYLSTYMSVYMKVFSLPDNVIKLKKTMVDEQMARLDFEEKVKEMTKQLIEEKNVALHKFHLLEDASDPRDKDAVVDRLDELEEEHEALTSRVAYYKDQVYRREVTIAQLIDEIEELKKTPTRERTSSHPSDDIFDAGKQDRRIIEDTDERAGHLVFARNDAGTKVLKGGTKVKLIERIVAYGTVGYDPKFLSAFLLTFRSFMTPLELLTDLSTHYELAALQSDRGHICAALTEWVDMYWGDFQDAQMSAALDALMVKIGAAQPKLKEQLFLLVSRKQSGAATITAPVRTTARKGSILDAKGATLSRATLSRNKSIIGSLDKAHGRLPYSSNTQALSILDMDPLEFARQITLIEHEMYQQIKPFELLDQAWLSDKKASLAPNIVALTAWSIKISHWVVEEIVRHPGPENVKTRAAVYERFVLASQCLFKLNNFNGCTEILTALQASPVYRLKDTQNAVSSKVRRIMDDLAKETSSEQNYKKIRRRLEKISDAQYAEPTMPFPGMVLQDLTFHDGGGKLYIDAAKKIINFQKLQTTATYIFDFLKHQQVPFPFEPNERLQMLLRSDDIGKSTDAAQYDMSLLAEPRK